MGKQKLILSVLFSFFVSLSWAHINPEARGKSNSTNLTVNSREDCLEPQTQIEVEVNNVRARLLTGGDVWWDGDGIGRYVVPKPPVGSGIPEVSSIFAGSVWIGGNDPSGGLKIAANTYRINSGDFSTGPLIEDEVTGLFGTDLEDCNNWDLFFQVTGDEVRKVFSDFDEREDPTMPLSADSIPDNVKFWPGKGNPFFFDKYEFDLPDAEQGLGSFWDENADGEYDPRDGDFPVIEIRGCFNTLVSRQQAIEYVPDEMTFWIYNDAGRTHFETMGRPIQMEVQVQAFAYATNDEINNMTFQRYKLINRASEDIRDCYFAMWVDPDLGCFTDDYVGCDVPRSLAYTYNQDALDGESGTNCPGGIETYKEEVPIIGTDYFRGPLGPKIISLDAAGDTVLNDPPLGSTQFDTIVELGMSSFMYFNNPGSTPTPLPQTADPNQDFEYYNYLQGRWRDGTAATFGGTGFNLMSTDTVRYMFPDDPNIDGGWSMCEGGLAAGDRRTLQASGPFLLLPGAVNELIIGAVWVPDLDYPCPDISRLQAADDLAQALFDNCFDIIDGPDAPDVCAVELDQELVLVLSNDTRSNNAFEEYSENDIFAPEEIMSPERDYFFEGYIVYQLQNPQVTPQEYSDPEKARPIRTFDVKNGVSEVYNWTPQIIPGQVDNIWIPERVIQSPDQGVQHSFVVTEDAFGDRLINHTKYYFSVVAYGHNEYAPFDPSSELGQRKPYLEGRKNIQVYTFIPRPIVYDSLQSNYGDGAIITRIQGVGVGGNFVDVDSSVYDAILAGNFDGRIKYQEGEGPISIKIFNPLVVQEGTYNLKVEGDFSAANCGLDPGATWVLTDPNGITIASEQTIDQLNEQILTDYGFSISLTQTEDAGEAGDDVNGGIGTELEYEDESLSWYNAVRDNGATNLNDFQAGFAPLFNFMRTANGEVENELDPEEAFSLFGTGEFYPYFLTSSAPPPNTTFPYYLTPAFDQQAFGRTASSFSQLNNVDIVMTDDRSKWSKCVVIETASKFFTDNGLETIEGARSFDLRRSPSVDINGNPLNDGTVGLGYFPGYAIDVETGERLNIFFGENSFFNEEYRDLQANPENRDDALGYDMLFNPGSELFNLSQDVTFFTPDFLTAGGGHAIYVTRQKYDECAEIYELLEPNFNLGGKISVMKAITWTSLALTNPEVEMLPYDQGLIPTDLTVKLRVDNPYSLQEDFVLGVDGCGEVVEGNLPEYEFEIRDAAALALTAEQQSSVLDIVNVVPNPYYGYSAYETGATTTTVKITNLPDRADINIFTLDGRFVKKFERAVLPAVKTGSNPGVATRQTIPDLEWDLKNFRGIPVASGVYLIHVVAPDLGEERTIKWFGINRKFDATGL